MANSFLEEFRDHGDDDFSSFVLEFRSSNYEADVRPLTAGECVGAFFLQWLMIPHFLFRLPACHVASLN
jgi:hypothetical protein